MGLLFVFLPVKIYPDAGILPCLHPKGRVDLAVGLRRKRLNFPLPLRQDSQGWCLNPTYRRNIKPAMPGPETGQGPGRIQPHQPIGF